MWTLVLQITIEHMMAKQETREAYLLPATVLGALSCENRRPFLPERHERHWQMNTALMYETQPRS
jgi:hypothetical protein